MSSRSSDSDTHSQRAYPRVEQGVRENPPSLSSRIRVDSTDFRNMGAHFSSPTTKAFYPDDIEFSESETSSEPRESSLTPQPMTIQALSQDHKDRPTSNSPSTPTPSPAQRGPYLEPSEFPEFKRQQELKRKRPVSSGHSSTSSHTAMHNRPRYHSPCTTVDMDIAPASGAATSFSTSHTPSHHSAGTVDDEGGEDAENAEGPRPPHPYSEYHPYDPGYGRGVVGEE